jgi:hypothetical protein
MMILKVGAALLFAVGLVQLWAMMRSASIADEYMENYGEVAQG